MSNYTIESLPTGVVLEGCTVARSSANNSIIFIRADSGKIYTASRRYQVVDLLADWGSNEKDRSAYAKLAGISVKELNAARKAAKQADEARNRAVELRRLKRDAEKLGMKLVKV